MTGDTLAMRLCQLLVSSAFALCLVVCSKQSPEPSGQTQALAQERQPLPAASVDTMGRQVAVLAGGCFWGMQEILRSVPGVLETEVGYTGGSVRNPSYADVSNGSSGHAEAVRVVFDPSRLSYRDLLEKWFFRMHDPTTNNRQGNDVGTQYRSAIFVSSGEQRRVAEEVIGRLNRSGKLKDPVVTSIEAAGTLTPAESYHQDYLQKNPGGYSCHYLRDDWI